VNAQVPAGVGSGTQSLVVTTASGASPPFSVTMTGHAAWTTRALQFQRWGNAVRRGAFSRRHICGPAGRNCGSQFPACTGGRYDHHLRRGLRSGQFIYSAGRDCYWSKHARRILHHVHGEAHRRRSVTMAWHPIT
jgi:hypothetical protein